MRDQQHPRRPLAGASVALLLNVFLLSGCSAPRETPRPAGDGRYDSHFPQQDVAPILERIARSVHMVTAIAYYKVYTIAARDSLQASELLPGVLERSAPEVRYVNTVNVGAATILSLGTREALILTCAHVVDYPDTILSYHLDASGSPTAMLSSVALRARVSLSVGVFPEGGELEVVALDSDQDIALLGNHFTQDLAPTVSAFPYSFGTTADLEWGTFVYVLGYPRGHRMVTHGLVSLGRRPAQEGFFIDAGMGRGFSGGPVLAIRDELPHVELVGMARMMPGQTSFVLVPELSDAGVDFDPGVPYRGDAFIHRQTELHYGMARAISADAILQFLEQHRSTISEAGYLPPTLHTPGEARPRE
jgi:S1-C subfamily serine protease